MSEDVKDGVKSAICVLLIVMALAALFIMVRPARGMDDGRYANSPLKSWFDGLRSGRGPCCSDADGNVVLDADWDVVEGHYRVRIQGEWVEVPDDALLREPNKFGRTMVWPMFNNGHPVVRCFIPGALT